MHVLDIGNGVKIFQHEIVVERFYKEGCRSLYGYIYLV